MPERSGTDLDDLAKAEALIVSNVEDLAFGRLGLVHGQKDGVSEILDIAERVEHGATVGQDKVGPLVEDAAHDRPFPWRQLARPVHPRIAKVGGFWLMGKDLLFGGGDAVRLAVVVLRGGCSVFAYRSG